MRRSLARCSARWGAPACCRCRTPRSTAVVDSRTRSTCRCSRRSGRRGRPWAWASACTRCRASGCSPQGPTSRRSSGSPRCCPVSCSGRTACPRRTPGPTRPRCVPRPCGTATRTSSTAPRRGRPTAERPTSTRSWRARPMTAVAGSRASWCRRTRLA
jgi:hypothetical protein